VKLVHLVGFIIKKFVTMHGHTNIKFTDVSVGVLANLETIYCHISTRAEVPIVNCFTSHYAFVVFSKHNKK